ncbi:alpha/beta hydrolase [Brevibacillus fluminis]|uniref:alpha/beta hydrolase n=1 Tax=Brevibacillus fluminis TaxID=511487 RepID=UPI003F8AF68F
MKVNRKTALVNEKEVQYTHIENASSAVCFMFSGTGYTYEKPLFYYSTMTMLQNQYDVVHVHYSYEQDVFKLSSEDLTTIIYNDVNAVITEVFNSRQYLNTVFLGKSLGTIPIINRFMRNDEYLNSKLILLTPLLKFDTIFEALMMSNHLALIVIGNRDTHYITSKIQAIENKPNIRIEEIPNANHSLDIEPTNTLDSILALEKVLKSIGEFLSDSH